MLNVLTNLDILIYRRLISLQQSPCIIRSARLLSRSGDGWLYGLFGLAMVWQWDAQSLRLIMAGLLAFLIELPCFMLLKAMIKRDRPFTRVMNSSSVIIPADKFSMPSGHTSAAFLMAALVGYFFSVFLMLVLCWATLVGLSRIVLGVHYPSDVLAGAALGTSCAVLGIIIAG